MEVLLVLGAVFAVWTWQFLRKPPPPPPPPKPKVELTAEELLALIKSIQDPK